MNPIASFAEIQDGRHARGEETPAKGKTTH